MKSTFDRSLRHLPHNRLYPANMRAFTLLETMIVIVIVGILAAIAIPSLLTFMQRNKVNALTQELMSTLSYAKSEAIKRDSVVKMCIGNSTACASSSNTNWASGWVVFVSNTSSFDTAVTVNDKDLSTEMTLTATGGGSTAPLTTITFDSSGFPGTTTNITFTLSPTDCRSSNKRLVTLSPTGRLDLSEQAC